MSGPTFSRFSNGSTRTAILTVANAEGSTASCSTNTAATETTSPSVVLTAPTARATVSGSSVTLTASSSDIVVVTSVQFKIDGVNVGSSGTSSPYSVTWNSTLVADGAHIIAATRARATSPPAGRAGSGSEGRAKLEKRR